MEMHYATIVEAISDALPNESALVFGERRLSWSELDQRAAKLATVMLEAGITAGDRVGLFLYNCSEYMEAMLAAMKIRAVPININFRYTSGELKYLLDDSGANGPLFHESLRDVVEGANADLALSLSVADEAGGEYTARVSAAQPAARIARDTSDDFMLYTGGTTGMPKAVVYDIGTMTAALGNLVSQYFGLDNAETPEAMVKRAVDLHARGSSFVSLPASPLMHTAGVMNGGIAMQLLGGSMVILTGRSFDAEELWQTVERERVNYMVIVGDAFAKPMLASADQAVADGRAYSLESLRAVVSSGVMWSADSKRRLLEFKDMLLIDGMGATEGPMAIQVSSRQSPPSEGASFQALPDTRLFDENDNEIAPGSEQQGFIAIGSALLPRGYLGDAEKTAKTFRVINGHRYGFTGDMGKLDKDGKLIFLGRGSGCINTAGEKVYPEEVEECLKADAAVEDCLVVGIPDERFGQRVAAVLAFAGNEQSPQDKVNEIVAGKLAGYKVPRKVVAVDQIRRGPNGKPDLAWAKDLATDNQEF